MITRTHCEEEKLFHIIYQLAPQWNFLNEPFCSTHALTATSTGGNMNNIHAKCIKCINAPVLRSAQYEAVA